MFFDQDLTWKRTDNVETIEGVTTNEVLLLYNNLKRNPTFRRQFVASYCILHGSIYTPERCKSVADSICNLVKNALAFEWRNTSNTYNKMQKEMWGQAFRQARIRSLMNAYNLPDSLNITINTNNATARIRIEGQLLPFSRFCGVLFGHEKVAAECTEGYEFIGWKDDKGNWISRNKECPVTKDGTYTAVYDMAFKENIPPICINEVSAANNIFVNEYGKRADWIELYNRGKDPIDVAGLYFSDDASDPLKYQLDAAPGTNTVVRPDGHIVIWCDDKPSLNQPHLPFKLKNAENGFLSLQPSDGKWKETMRFGMHSSKESVGRYPDGGCSSYTFYHPTIRERNMPTMYDTFISSDPSTIDTLPSSGNIASVIYYSIDGKRARPHTGLYIKVVHYKDGRQSTSKVLMKDGIAISTR